MTYKSLSFSVLVVLLAGCSANPSSVKLAGAGQGIHVGMDRARSETAYWYNDATHPNAVSQSSPQADYDANHGAWLWPPEAGGG